MKTASQIKNTKSSYLSMISLYDSCFAGLAEQANMDLILVGDSLANVILGLEKTTQVTVEMMKIFVAAVSRGARDTHIIVDMPFGSYDNPKEALSNARQFTEIGAHSVKIEGFEPEIVKYLVKNQIPVMAHLGLLPQTATSYRKLDQSQLESLLNQAIELEKAGVYSIVLEHLEDDVATSVTQQISIPTIGISSGTGTNGQVLVAYDLLGITAKIPPFVKPVLNLREQILKAFQGYTRK